QIRQYVTNEYEGYAQDSIRLTSNLNVTLGVRYSFATVPYEKNGLQVRPNVDLGKWFSDRIYEYAERHPFGQVTTHHLYTWRKSKQRSRLVRFHDMNNFAPRVSFAYSPGFDKGVGHAFFGPAGKSSIRGG